MIKRELAGMNKHNKFSIIFSNPPYDGTLHLKFLKKYLEIANNIVSIQPIIWLFGKNDQSTAIKDINIIKNALNEYKSEIEKIDSTQFDCAVPQELGIINIDLNKICKNVKIIHDTGSYNVDDIYTIKKYGNNVLLKTLNEKLEKLYKYDNFWNHIIFGPRAKGHLGKKENEKKIDFNPNLNDIIINIPQIRGHINQTDFYTACENKLEPIKYKNYNNKGKTTPWSYIICNNIEYGKNIVNYLKTDFVRSCLFFNKFSTGLPIESIPWFDFSDDHFSKSPKEIDDWLFKKYNISDEIRKHIEEILPDYYNIRK